MRRAIPGLLALASLSVSPVHAHDGDLDPTFGSGGRSMIAFDLEPTAPTDFAEGVAVQPDGRIVVVGDVEVARGPDHDTDFGVARLLPDGGLDSSFGNAATPGRTHVDFPAEAGWSGDDYGQFVALAPDGGIYAGGLAAPDGATRNAIVRLLPNGHVDASWANNGRFVLKHVGYFEFNAALVQPDGKLVVVGRYDTGTVAGQPGGDFWILRLTPGGNLDSSFGYGGEAIVPINLAPESSARRDRATCVARGIDGSLLVGGSAQVGSKTSDTAFAVAKLRPNGTLDSTFGVGGIWVRDFGPTYDAVRGIAVDGKERIVLAGVTGDNGEFVSAQYAVVRLLPNGALDWSFSGDGWLTGIYVAGQTANVSGVAVQGDRKVIIAGTTRYGTDFRRDYAVARYTEDGSYDLDFGNAGIRTAPGYARDDEGRGVALQNGRVIIVGGSRYDSLDNWDFGVLRLTRDLLVRNPPN